MTENTPRTEAGLTGNIRWDFGAAIRESIITGQETPGEMADRMLVNPRITKYLTAQVPAQETDITARKFTYWFLGQNRGKQRDFILSVWPRLSDLLGPVPGRALAPDPQDDGEPTQP